VGAGQRNTDFHLLTKGNEKLGLHSVYKFSLPTGPASMGGTCPGATEWCLKACYARGGWYLKRPLLIGIRNENLQVVHDLNQFSVLMAADLSKLVKKQERGRDVFVRVHDSGDFHTPEYAAAWASIAKAFPTIRFWAYTHSWTVPGMLPALEALRDMPNFQLFLSVDPSTTEQPPSGWRIASMANSPLAAPGPVCMVQTGKQPDCESCGFCFLGTSKNVQWLPHGKAAQELAKVN